MLPMLERELVFRRKWTTKEILLDYYAIGQSTPGIIAVNVATFIGYNKYGLIGSAVATAGIVTPSIIIITILAKFIKNFTELVWVQKALSGINIAVAALLTQAVQQFCAKAVKNIWGWIIFAAAFISMFFFKVDSIWIIICGALAGIIISNIQNYKKIHPTILKNQSDSDGVSDKTRKNRLTDTGSTEG